MASSALAAFLAVLLGGIIFLFAYKFRIYRLNKIEWQKFENDQRNMSEMNPLYKEPKIQYRNPLHSENQSKSLRPHKP